MINPITIDQKFSELNLKMNNKQICNDYKKNSFDKSHNNYSLAISFQRKADIAFQGKIKISPIMIEKLISEYSSGKSLKDSLLVLSGMETVISIGYANKLLHSQSNWADIEELHNANNQNSNTIINDELKQKVVKDYCEGEIPSKIAKKYGISKISVMRIVDKDSNSDKIKEKYSKNDKAKFTHIPKETLVQIRELYMKGKSAGAIAQEFRISTTSVLNYLSKQEDYEEIKKEHNKNNQTKRFIPKDDFLERAVSEYRSGKQIYVIAKELNCGETTLHRYLKKQTNFNELEREHIENKKGIAIVTDNMIQQMVQLYREGLFYKDIAKRIGCSETTVLNYIKAQSDYDSISMEHYKNAQHSRKGLRKSIVTPDIINKMTKLYQEGYPYEHVGNMLKLSPTTVSKYIQANDKFDEIEKAHVKNHKGAFTIVTDEKIMLIISLYRMGKTLKEISIVTRCSFTSIIKIIKNSEVGKEIHDEHKKNYKGQLAIITQEKIKQMEKLYREGKTYVQIAEILNCSTSTVMQHLRRHPEWHDIRKDFVENYSGKKIKLSDEKQLKIKELYAKGLKVPEIANKIGCSVSTVLKYLKNKEEQI